jgi:GINS complex subunit 1
VTRDGSVELTRNSVHLMWRDECQPLIQEGVLEQL